MFAGHVGAALAIGSAERRVNLGAFVCAAMALDAVLWVLVLLGRESVRIPGDFIRSHQAQFEFPYSHGLLAGLAWSAVAATVTFALGRPLGGARRRGALLMAAAVFSHWLLDALVHVPELPLAGSGSARVGLGRGRRLGLALLLLVTLAATVLGMTIAPPPPSVAAMATSSLATIAAVTALAGWIGRARQSGAGCG
jgi:hypothetical protein